MHNVNECDFTMRDRPFCFSLRSDDVKKAPVFSDRSLFLIFLSLHELLELSELLYNQLKFVSTVYTYNKTMNVNYVFDKTTIITVRDVECDDDE